MGESLFIADLHLDGGRPRILDLFVRFIDERARRADALYILGDLFEYWVGDDDPAPALRPAIAALKRLSGDGVPVFFQHGNRDFLVGETLSAECGWALLPEMQVIDLYGRPTLILHGDSLCTDDREHLRFRNEVRGSDWQRHFLSQDLEARHALASHYRTLSRESTRDKPPEITDVNMETVKMLMRDRGVTRMIHGHTHRPTIHEFELDGERAERIVLGDWYEHGSVLSVKRDALELGIFF